MSKQLLKERFQQLAGIKPLYGLNEEMDQLDRLRMYGDDYNADIDGPNPDALGDAGTDKRSGQVIGDILQLIKSTGIDPEEVIEAIKMSDNFKNSGLPKMDPDNWGFKNPKTGEYNK